jgi:hypothetical protein
VDWLILFAIIALPSGCYLLGVWAASETERRAFARFVGEFDEVTRDHRDKTPRVRMTLYQRFVDRTHKPPKSKEEAALRDRRRVFLRFRSVENVPDDEKLTRKMRR